MSRRQINTRGIGKTGRIVLAFVFVATLLLIVAGVAAGVA